MQKITPFLWFDHQAEEAANFYTGIFANGKILDIVLYGENGSGPAGSVMTVSFRIEEQTFVALNGGLVYTFTPAISFVVDCKTQEEVDRLWERLTADGGAPGRCGWLTDKYGVSWQIVPARLMELLTDPDPVKANRVMQTMLAMTRIDIAALEAACAGAGAA